ncbi:11824_t:CDS:2 [Funneliformis caledonium]|uniref:11824_t:CDS:1 n=1 Tax=Funneliformis caledonium TaxID=1117310 RepID=A0A9N9APP6_9GLOM|nr:11824_t:CDS:2 [Funneliformis caledonium]
MLLTIKLELQEIIRNNQPTIIYETLYLRQINRTRKLASNLHLVDKKKLEAAIQNDYMTLKLTNW